MEWKPSAWVLIPTCMPLGKSLSLSVSTLGHAPQNARLERVCHTRMDCLVRTTSRARRVPWSRSHHPLVGSMVYDAQAEHVGAQPLKCLSLQRPIGHRPSKLCVASQLRGSKTSACQSLQAYCPHPLGTKDDHVICQHYPRPVALNTSLDTQSMWFCLFPKTHVNLENQEERDLVASMWHI